MIFTLHKFGWSTAFGYSIARGGFYADAWRHFPPEQPWTQSDVREVVCCYGRTLATAIDNLAARMNEKYRYDLPIEQMPGN